MKEFEKLLPIVRLAEADHLGFSRAGSHAGDKIGCVPLKAHDQVLFGRGQPVRRHVGVSRKNKKRRWGPGLASSRAELKPNFGDGLKDQAAAWA